MNPKIANVGYFALNEQVDMNTPVIPSKFVPLYEESMSTNMNVDEDSPIIGNRAGRFQTLPGLRQHNGSINVMAEPNTSLYIWSLLLKRGAVSGAGPYTWPFIIDDPAYHTIEFKKGDTVFRFWGVKASAIRPTFEDNKMQYEVDISALGSFIAREISAVSGAGPYTVTLKTTYDSQPTKGLVVGDLIQFFDISSGTTINATVATIPGSTTFTTTTNPTGIADGDIITLRGQTPTLTVLTPFMFAKTEFRFGNTAAAALSATQTRLRQGTGWAMMHRFNDENGEQLSGGFDPGALVHTAADAEFVYNAHYSDAQNINRYLNLGKLANVTRHWSGDSNQYELRVTLNNLRHRDHNNDPLNSNELIFDEQTLIANYDQSDAQIYDVKVINALAAY